MSYQERNRVPYGNPITAKNIARVQEQYEKETKKGKKSKTVLNGRVKTEQTLNGDLAGEADFEYEFLYSVSDEENGDHYNYEFDAYPAEPETPRLVASGNNEVEGNEYVQRTELQYNITNSINGNSGRCNGKWQVLKRRQIKSATAAESEKGISSLSVRPKSASFAKENKSEVAAKGQNGLESKNDVIKEVAFKDTDSVVSKASSCPSKVSFANKARTYGRRKSVSYDPDLEKASAYIHGGGKNFSRSNTSLSPLKYGMKHLQMNYTETNLETNQTVIFLDLLKNSHQRSQIRGEQIRNIERRLEAKRHNPLYSTSFYENKNIPDPFHRNAKKTARSVAQKKIERKEKIKQMTDEIHTGYIPTQLTMKIADRVEVEDIGKKCRYLRCQSPAGL